MTNNTGTTKSTEYREVQIAGHTIKLKFQDILPAKTDEEIRILRDDIEVRGVLDKLVAWKEEGILLDGYHRTQICEELGREKELDIEWLSFPDEESAKM